MIEKYTDYVIRCSWEEKPAWRDRTIFFVRIDGTSFPNSLQAMQYLVKECGFSVREAREYIESLPDARNGVEI